MPRSPYRSGLPRFSVQLLLKPQLPPGLLFALLNTPFVKRQIRNKQFTRDVIDTLGQRIKELQLPLPADLVVRKEIADFFDNALTTRAKLRASLHETTENLSNDARLRLSHRKSL